MARIYRAAAFAFLIGSVGLQFASMAAAQQVPKAPATTASPAAAAPSSAGTGPDTTTASFGDWTLRCDRRQDMTPPQRFCEMAYAVQKPGDATVLGQLAVGRVTHDQPLRFTAVLPVNVALKALPKLIADGPEPVSVELAWSRCIIGACFSDAAATDEVLRRLRARTEPGRIDYRDGTDREASLPISFRGFGQALEALGREPTN